VKNNETISSAVHIAIVGRPNVGKSTLFNRLVGKRKSITDAQAGTTRDRLYQKITIVDKDVLMIDTGGIQYSESGTIDHLVDREVNKAIVEASIILFMCDIDNLTVLDHQLIQDIRYRNKKVILVVNKVDETNTVPTDNEYYKLGLGEPVFISALHGNNMDDLLDRMYALLPENCVIPNVQHEFCIAIVGEPNAGKSTLLNQFLQYERAVVSDVPGTTRDFVEETFVYNDRYISLIDTAGIKKKKKLKSTAAVFSLFRSQSIVKKSDVVLLLIDALKGPQYDTRMIYKMIQDMKRACLILVNKWDLVENVTMEDYVKRLNNQYGFMKKSQVLFISAKTGRNLDKVMEKTLAVWENYTASISTNELNLFLEEVKRKNPPPPTVKFKYIVQVDIKPPTFILFVKNKHSIKKNYMGYLSNALIDGFGLYGLVPKIYLKEETKQ
jgi:GTP-binding protein